MANKLSERLHALGFEVTQDQAGDVIGGDCGNLFARRIGGAGMPPLLFCAHMDTVQPAYNKRVILDQDGRIHSAGDTILGADDVSAICAILEALQTLIEADALQRDIEVLFTVSEETYASGCAVFDSSVIHSKEAYVPDFDGMLGQAVIAAPSILSFRAEIKGKASHAGFAPELGINAISVAAHAIDRIRTGWITPTLSLNIGTIHGGLLTNIVPEHCVIEGEIRAGQHEDALVQQKTLQDTLEASCELFGAELVFSSKCLIQAYQTSEDAPVVQRYFKTCRELGITPQAIRTFGGSDLNVLAQRGISGIVIASAMHECHTTNEFTTVEELCTLSQIIAHLICHA